MDRKEFLSQVGLGAAALLVPICFGGLSSCNKIGGIPTPSPNIDFTLDTSIGALSKNGGFMVNNGVLVARTNTGTYLAVSAACTHQGSNLNYYASSNNFICPNHGAKFDNNGNVTQGPARTNLSKYNTTLIGTQLRVYS